MLRSLRVCLFRFFLSFVLAYQIVALSGMLDVAYAVSCTDVISSQTSYRYNESLYNFKYFNGNNKTYAIALSGITGNNTAPDNYFAFAPNFTFEYTNYGTDSVSLKKQLSTGKYGAARPVSITSDAVKQFITDNYGAFLGSGQTLVDAWKEYGEAAPFTTINGSSLPYISWASLPAPTAAPAAVAMDSTGGWTPVTSGTFTKQIVEFDGKLDCAIDPTVTIPPPEPPPTNPDAATLDELASYDGLICMGDINNDGELSGPFESGKCETTTQGNLCPVGALDCNTDYQPPVCPSGSTLNTERDMCQKDPDQVNCPTGYTWDQSTDKCVMYPPCSDGGTYNASTDRCEKLVQNDCPVGYTFDSSLQVCQKAVSCPDGGSFNASLDRCEKPVTWQCPTGYTYNSALAICEAAPYCTNGWSYSTTKDRCQITPNNCPTGYSYNAALDKCVVSASCSSGGIINGTTDKCELTATTTCLAGWTYNSSTGKCEQAPTCASPGTYSATYNVCLAAVTGASCPSGFYYNATYGKCTAAPICNSGAYNAANDRCEASPSYSCSDSSYTYNPTRARCEKTPFCPSGMTYNTTYNVCTQAIVKSCPTGYTYNSTRNRCEYSPPTCPNGTNYNASTNRCEANPGCSSGTYDSASNQCVSSTSYVASCPSGYTFDGKQCALTYSASLSEILCKDSGSKSVICSGTADDAYESLCFDLCYGYNNFLGPGCGGPDTMRDCSVEEMTSCEYLPYITGGGYQDLTRTTTTSTGYTCSFDYDLNETVCVPYTSTTTSYENAAYNTYRCSNYSCPSGGALSGTNCVLVASLTCPSGGTLTGTTCTTATNTSASCPAGTSLDTVNDKCVSNPTCNGGSYDNSTDTCYVSYTPTCSQGTYNSTSGLCTLAAACSNGALDSTIDVCYQSASAGCPSGYSLSGSICIATPSCTSPGAFNGGSIDLCTTTATYSCSTGYSYSATYGQCYLAANCNGGGLNTTSDKCEMAYSLTCPGGYTLNVSTCQAAPICATGGSYNTAINLCSSTASVCSAGTLDTSLDVCYQSAGCAGGTLNVARDKCEAASTPTCGTYTFDSTNTICYSSPVCDLGAYQTVRDRCEASVTRNCGTYTWDATAVKCLQNVTCPTSTPFTTSLATDIDRCVGAPDHVCSTGLTWNGLPVMQCEAVPICNGAIYYDPVANQCLQSLGCPYGSTYTCMQNTKGVYQCSPYDCVNAAAGEGVELEPFTEDYLQNDAPRDEQGNCLGQVYIFSGKPSRCRPEGWTVGFINDCCAGGDVIPEDTGNYAGLVSGAYSLYKGATAAYAAYTTYNSVTAAGGTFDLAVKAVDTAIASGASSATIAGTQAGAEAAVAGVSQTGSVISAGVSAMGPALGVYAVGAVTSALGGNQDVQLAAQLAATLVLMSGPQAVVGVVVMTAMRFMMGTGCDANDIMTSNDIASDRCHYVGRYCEKKILGMCVQKAKGHCCYNSILARIIHEQGRPQLVSFQPDGAWGSAKRPNCRGFTPEEFQAVDFSKVDMSEYYGQVLKDIEQKVQGAADRVNATITDRFTQIQNAN